jgi:SAM-dependent methyltransferase
VDEHGFPDGFFSRADEAVDDVFYAPPRLVTHIDDGAIAAVGALYAELGIQGRVLDLMGSWVSHFTVAPAELTVLGMNAVELGANEQARATVVHDLNADPRLPFADDAFDGAVCCVSVDYLVRPVEVFTDVARVVRPGGIFVCTFSNEYRSVGKGLQEGWTDSISPPCPIGSHVLRVATSGRLVNRRTMRLRIRCGGRAGSRVKSPVRRRNCVRITRASRRASGAPTQR